METPAIKTFVYAGTIGVAQDMDNLLRLARRLQDRKDIRILLIGAGSETERIRQAINNEGIANIEMRDEVAPERLREMLRDCDVGLISLDRRLRSHNVPGKLMTYLELGLPVLASVNPENILKEIVESADAGMVVWNGDDAAFEAAARQLADDADLRRHMAESARQLCERRFSAESVAAHITSRIATV